MVAGCPVGESDFIAAQTTAASAEIEQMVNTLMELQVLAQDKLLVLRKSLQVKMAHFVCCVQYDLAEALLRKTEVVVRAAILSLVGRQEADLDLEQLYLHSERVGSAFYASPMVMG
jgi:hypothetical protein